jgi:hypothetical protein
MALTDLECPNCGASELAPDQEQKLLCLFCGSSFGEVTRICPECGHYNDSGDRHCELCGTPIVRDCPACGADNWTLADHCVQCGRNLDLIDQMARRWQQSTQEWLHERQAVMASLKEEEERASQERLAALVEIERQRQQALAQARAMQKEQERRLYTILAVVAAVFVLIVIVMILVSLIGN